MKSRQKYFFTSEEDAFLELQFKRRDKKANTIKNAAKKIGKPYGAVLRRLRQNGFTNHSQNKDNYKPWSSEELEILERYSLSTHETTQRALKSGGYERSVSAIVARKKRENLLCKIERGGEGIYSANELANLLGCDSHTVLRWIKRGWLKAVKRGQKKPNQGEIPHHYDISSDAVRQLFIEYLPDTYRYIYSATDIFWLVDVLTKGKVGKN